jgi:hypothetical protein
MAWQVAQGVFSLSLLSTPPLFGFWVRKPDQQLFYSRGFGVPLGSRVNRPNPRSYNVYLKAYSVAMLPGRERENLSYGGKSA